MKELTTLAVMTRLLQTQYQMAHAQGHERHQFIQEIVEMIY